MIVGASVVPWVFSPSGLTDRAVQVSWDRLRPLTGERDTWTLFPFYSPSLDWNRWYSFSFRTVHHCRKHKELVWTCESGDQVPKLLPLSGQATDEGSSSGSSFTIKLDWGTDLWFISYNNFLEAVGLRYHRCTCGVDSPADYWSRTWFFPEFCWAAARRSSSFCRNTSSSLITLQSPGF